MSVGVVHWQDVASDADGSGGILRATVTWRRLPSIVLELEVRSGHRGWPIRAHGRSGRWPDVTGELVSATLAGMTPG